MRPKCWDLPIIFLAGSSSGIVSVVLSVCVKYTAYSSGLMASLGLSKGSLSMLLGGYGGASLVEIVAVAWTYRRFCIGAG